MKRLIWLIVMGISCAPLPRPVIVSIHPKSDLPPIIRTSVNQNVHLSQYRIIAIVSISRHSIPTLETMLNEWKDSWAKGTLDAKLAQIKASSRITEIEARARSDSLAFPYLQQINAANKDLQEMSAALDEYLDSLYLGHMQTLKRDHFDHELFLKRSTYEAYESQFIKYGFDIIERDRIDAVLQELNLSELGLTDDESARTAGKMLAAQAVCLIENYSISGEYLEPPDPTVSVTRETFKVVVVETGQIALTGMHQNMINGTELMFYALSLKILAQYDAPR